MQINLKTLAASAVLALWPTFASALTLTVDDLATAGVDSTTVGATVASAFGTVGVFNVAIASGGISSTADSYTLNSTSVQVSGVGTLQITTEQTGLTGFSQPLLSLTGTGSVTDQGTTVTIEHMIDLGGGYQTIGSVLSFVGGTPGPVNLSDIVSETVSGSAVFDLRSVITITTIADDQTANVNASLVVTPVPLPAAGVFLISALSGLAGVAGLKRRRKRATQS